MNEGVDAPIAVKAGSTSPIVVHAPQSRTLLVVDTNAGVSFPVTVGADKKARFELPVTAVEGTTLVIVDEDAPERAATIHITNGLAP